MIEKPQLAQVFWQDKELFLAHTFWKKERFFMNVSSLANGKRALIEMEEKDELKSDENL